MALDVGTNSITIAEDAIIDSLAYSGAFQTLVDADNPYEAKASIYCVEIPQPTNTSDTWTAAEWTALFPCAIIQPPEEGASVTYKHHAIGAPLWEHVRDTAFDIRFERFLPATMTEQEAIREFQNSVGDIMEEFISQSGVDGRFAVTQAAPNGPPEIGPYQQYKALGFIQRWVWSITNEVAS